MIPCAAESPLLEQLGPLANSLLKSLAISKFGTHLAVHSNLSDFMTTSPAVMFDRWYSPLLAGGVANFSN